MTCGRRLLSAWNQVQASGGHLWTYEIGFIMTRETDVIISMNGNDKL